MKKKNNNKILIVLGIGLIGGLIYLLHKNKKQTNNSQNRLTINPNIKQITTDKMLTTIKR